MSKINCSTVNIHDLIKRIIVKWAEKDSNVGWDEGERIKILIKCAESCIVNHINKAEEIIINTLEIIKLNDSNQLSFEIAMERLHFMLQELEEWEHINACFVAVAQTYFKNRPILDWKTNFGKKVNRIIKILIENEIITEDEINFDDSYSFESNQKWIENTIIETINYLVEGFVIRSEEKCKIFFDTLRLKLRNLDDDNLLYAVVFEDLGEFLMKESRLECAESAYNIPLARVPGKEKEARIVELLFQCSLFIRENTYHSFSVDLVRCLDKLAFYKYYNNKLEEAVLLFERSLEIQENYWGIESARNVDTLNRLAVIYGDLEKTEGASDCYRKILKIIKSGSCKNYSLVRFVPYVYLEFLEQNLVKAGKEDEMDYVWLGMGDELAKEPNINLVGNSIKVADKLIELEEYSKSKCVLRNAVIGFNSLSESDWFGVEEKKDYALQRENARIKLAFVNLKTNEPHFALEEILIAKKFYEDNEIQSTEYLECMKLLQVVCEIGSDI